jgi:hypothetical protein
VIPTRRRCRAATLFDANVPRRADANMAKLLASEACRKAAGAPSGSVMRDCLYDGPQVRMLVSGGRK